MFEMFDIFKKRPHDHPTLQASSIRRLSSSNSFLEANSELQRNAYLNKLSRIVAESQQRQQETTTSCCCDGQASAFIILPSSRAEGYLLYLRMPPAPSTSHYKWHGPSVQLFASMPVRLALYQHASKSCADEDDPGLSTARNKPNLILVTPKQSILKAKRVELKTKLKGTISLVKEKTSFHPNIESSLDELKDNILRLRSETSQFINLIEKDLKGSRYYKAIDQRYLNEIWRGYLLE